MSARGGRIGHGERLLALRRTPLVAAFAPEDLSLMADLLAERELAAGEVLLVPGEPVAALHFLVEGRVQVSRGGAVLGDALAGAIVGGLGFLARDADGFGAIAQEPSLCLSLDGDDADELFEDRYPLLHQVMRTTCTRLIEVQRHLRQCGPPDRIDALASSPRELDFVERILILRRAAPFARASLDALAFLSRGMVETRIEAGREVWAEGDDSGSLLMLVAGQVQCESTATGYAFVAGPGAPLGALESVAERPRWYRARTLTPVVALQGHAEGLTDVFEDNHQMARDYLAYVAAWLLRALAVGGPAGWPADPFLALAPAARG